jgi:hypothetical protein
MRATCLVDFIPLVLISVPLPELVSARTFAVIGIEEKLDVPFRKYFA